MATVLGTLGRILEQNGDLAGADSMLSASLEIHRKVLDAQHPSLAESLHNLAILRREQGRLDEAEELFREALAIRTGFGPGYVKLASTMLLLGDLLVEKGELDEAEQLLREGDRQWTEKWGEGHHLPAVARCRLAHCLAERGKRAEAESLFAASWPIVRESTWVAAGTKRLFLDRIVSHYERWGDPARADEYRDDLDAPN